MCIKIIPTVPWSPWRNEEQQPLQRLQRVCPGQSRIEDPLTSSYETSSHRLCITRPGVPLPLPRPPKEENQQPPQKRLPINLAHHQCAAAGIDPIDSPHPRIQCSGPLQKDPHPEPASGRALTPSRTFFSSPLAIAREQDELVPTTFPEGTQPRRVPAQWARTSVHWPQSGA